MNNRVYYVLPLAAYLFVAQGCSKLPSSNVASKDKASGKPHAEVAEIANGHFLDLKAAPAPEQTRTHSPRRIWTLGE